MARRRVSRETLAARKDIACGVALGMIGFALVAGFLAVTATFPHLVYSF